MGTTRLVSSRRSRCLRLLAIGLSTKSHVGEEVVASGSSWWRSLLLLRWWCWSLGRNHLVLDGSSCLWWWCWSTVKDRKWIDSSRWGSRLRWWGSISSSRWWSTIRNRGTKWITARWRSSLLRRWWSTIRTGGTKWISSRWLLLWWKSLSIGVGLRLRNDQGSSRRTSRRWCGSKASTKWIGSGRWWSTIRTGGTKWISSRWLLLWWKSLSIGVGLRLRNDQGSSRWTTRWWCGSKASTKWIGSGRWWSTIWTWSTKWISSGRWWSSVWLSRWWSPHVRLLSWSTRWSPHVRLWLSSWSTRWRAWWCHKRLWSTTRCGWSSWWSHEWWWNASWSWWSTASRSTHIRLWGTARCGRSTSSGWLHVRLWLSGSRRSPKSTKWIGCWSRCGWCRCHHCLTWSLRSWRSSHCWRSTHHWRAIWTGSWWLTHTHWSSHGWWSTSHGTHSSVHLLLWRWWLSVSIHGRSRVHDGLIRWCWTRGWWIHISKRIVGSWSWSTRWECGLHIHSELIKGIGHLLVLSSVYFNGKNLDSRSAFFRVKQCQVVQR
mmetsp:Transcript_19923/g.48921  ORF Transcript_19923/g.48921 Transcript_19923/m.48921 type:complete len:543 (+) Transcript_19923:925-2553(+)